METGYSVVGMRVKSDAPPIDNITKFSWNEEDFEEYTEWVEYSPQHKLELAKGVLESTDYIMCKMVEEMLTISSLSDLLNLFRSYKQTYRQAIIDRQEARTLVNTLTKQLETEGDSDAD